MKTIKIRVIQNARRNDVAEENGVLRVYVREKAESGRANRALIEILSDYFGVKKRSISIAAGRKSRDKIIKINF